MKSALCAERALGPLLHGRYDALRVLARGERSVVYETVDTMLEDRVALKAFAPHPLDPPGAMARLREEVRLARRVTHRNVCRILDVGWDEPPAPRAYLTMELLRGETVAQRLGRVSRLEPPAAGAIFAQILAGVAAIHGAGIVHGHLTSDHVFLDLDQQGRERAVVLSFGRARPIHRPTFPPLAAALDGQALGHLLHEMLTGRRTKVS
jgi:serine/threonine protein kinase